MPFFPNSALCSKNYPRNINQMPAVIFFASLDLEQKSLFMDGQTLTPASVSFAEDTRHQARSRIIILQALDNAVDSVKEALPKGSTC